MSLWREQIKCTFPTARIKDTADLRNGFPFDAADFNEHEGTPVIRIRDLVRGRTDTLVRGAVPANALVQRDDLVVGMDGDFNSRLWPGPEAALNQRLCLLRARPSVLDQRFLAYFIGIPLRAINDVTFFTTVKHLSSADLLAERIPTPPITLQRRIADFLDAETARIEALITAKQKMVKLGSARHLRWFSQLLDMGLGSSSFATGCPLRFVARVTGGLTVGKVYPGETRMLPYLRVANVQDGHLDLSDVAQIAVPAGEVDRFALRSGDLLVLEGNGNPQNLGRCCMWRGEIPGTVLHQNHVHVVRPGTRLLPEFLALVLRTEAARDYFTGGSNQVSIATLSQERLGGLRVPLPSVSEQRRLVDEVELEADRADRLRVSLAKQIELLREHRQALITAAVTGDLAI